MAYVPKITVKEEQPALQAGYVAEIVVSHAGRSFVGEVEAIDDRGVKILLYDWVLNGFVGDGLFVPWREITLMYIADDRHDLDEFLDRAAKREKERAEQIDGAPD
jgi:hypothetical protein